MSEPADRGGVDRVEDRSALTRRTLLLVGAGGVGVAAFGLWGRFALGDSFERHVADQLGLDLELSNEVLRRMREELGDYELRAAGFLVATQGPADTLLPASLRRDAVDAFVGPMFGLSLGLVTPFVMAGLNDTADYRACDVLQAS